MLFDKSKNEGKGTRRKEAAYINGYEQSKSDRAKSSSSAETRRRQVGKNLGFGATEAYKLLRTNLIFSMTDESACKIVGVTSALRGEGKSTTAINLAYVLAESGKRVLLVEADMRIPVLAAVLKMEEKVGLSHVLAGIGALNDAVRPSTLHKGLSVLTAGEIPPNPSELLSSKRMEQALESLSKAFEYIIIDLPPINAVSDGLAVSKLLSGMIVVVRQNYCDQSSLAEAMRRMELLEVKLLGFVLNGAESPEKRYKKYGYKYKYGHGYSYGYGYGYGRRKRSKEEGSAVDENVPPRYIIPIIPETEQNDQSI